MKAKKILKNCSKYRRLKKKTKHNGSAIDSLHIKGKIRHANPK
jgi:hypothetical protein